MIKIRIMGLPEEVETTANQLCQQLPIEDILHLGYAGLFKIRNMGRISCEEVMKKLNTHGYLMGKPAYFN